MPRFMSPMIHRRQTTDKLSLNTSTGSSNASLPPENDPNSKKTDSTIHLSNDQSAQSKQIKQSTNQSSSLQADIIEPIEPSEVRISEGTFKQIRDESLVLLSQGIPHRIERSEDGPFQIFVEVEKRYVSQIQLRLYHHENPPRSENPPLPLKFTFQPLWILAVPIACTVLDFSNIASSMHNAGIADASKILHGEWWRTITAMTLHADSRHLTGNLVSGFLALSFLHDRIPLAKLAPFLAIACAVANFFVAFTVQTNFRSLGFSGFVFATIGCLAVVEFRLMPRETRGMLRRFAPLCGAISLAVFLGLGENADILGHLYGFIAGLFCGFIPKKKTLRWGVPTVVTDIFWVLAYYAIFIIGWILAL